MRRLATAALVTAALTGAVIAGAPGAAVGSSGRKSEATVTIAGPSTVPGNSTCTWSAIVTNGVPPYDFYWYSSQGDSGPGQNFQATAPSRGPMELGVSVTDANGTVFVDRVVYASSSAPPCY